MKKEETQLAQRLDYDLAALDASEVVAKVVYGGETPLDDDDVCVEALKVLKALALDGWLDPARLSIVQIDAMLEDQ